MLEIEEDTKLHPKKKEMKFEMSYQKNYSSYPQLEMRTKNKPKLQIGK